MPFPVTERPVGDRNRHDAPIAGRSRNAQRVVPAVSLAPGSGFATRSAVCPIGHYAPMHPPLDPKFDVVFKILFADPRCRHALVAVLTAVLRPEKPIVDVTVLNPELPKDFIDDKGAQLDVLVELEDGRRVDVEMQSQSVPGLRQRALFYWARMYSPQIGRGGSHADLKPCIGVFILAFRELHCARFHSKFQVLEVTDHEPFSPHLELHVLELPKVPELSKVLEEQVALVRWGRFLAAESDAEREELAMQDPAIREAKDTLDRLSADPAVQDLVQRRRESLDLYEISLRLAEAEGEAKGRVETLCKAVSRLCEVLGIELDDQRRQALTAMSDTELDALCDTLTRERRWPDR
jgi:predicted transposase/invertase (TIGR01784 family)